MARINLLPWREELRKELQKQFFITMGFFVALVLIGWGVVHFANTLRIEYQQGRIQFLETQIANIDKKIKEIEALEKEKRNLKSRIDAIERLQGDRPLIVRFFDELVANIPDGISILSVQQNNNVIRLDGVAESNARVSSFMRNLEKSEWLDNPKLDVIESKDGKDDSGHKLSNFTMSFSQVVSEVSDEEEI